jgi:hypothetical protein
LILSLYLFLFLFLFDFLGLVDDLVCNRLLKLFSFGFQLFVNQLQIFVDFGLVQLEDFSDQHFVDDCVTIGKRAMQVQEERSFDQLREKQVAEQFVNDSVEAVEETENQPISEPFLVILFLARLQSQNALINGIQVSDEQVHQTLSCFGEENKEGKQRNEEEKDFLWVHLKLRRQFEQIGVLCVFLQLQYFLYFF